MFVKVGLKKVRTEDVSAHSKNISPDLLSKIKINKKRSWNVGEGKKIFKNEIFIFKSIQILTFVPE